MQVDQLFSILKNEFDGCEILTVDELIGKVLNSPIQPKPLCESLLFVWDWKGFILPNLTEIPLENHSKYNSFAIVKEQELVRLRAKRLPQNDDKELQPRSGIRLYKQGCAFEPVGAAAFRVEEIKFDLIMKGFMKYASKLPEEIYRNLLNSRGKLRDTLESLPNRKSSFPLMNLEDLPVQQLDLGSSSAATDSSLLDPIDTVETAIHGEIFLEEVRVGEYSEIGVNTDVCVYTSDVTSRPWVGRVTQMLGGKKFEIVWFTRKRGRGGTFHMMKDQQGKQVKSVLDLNSVMFWHMSENRSDESFTLSSYWLEAIRVEYQELDASVGV